MTFVRTFRIHPYQYLLDRVLRPLRGGSLIIDYWDGTSKTYGGGLPLVRLKLHHPRIVPRLAIDPDLAFGEAYQRGELEIEGRFEDFLRLIETSQAPMPALVEKLFHLAALFSRWRPLRTARHRRDVSRHYDLGNDFYRLWLDPTMTYSCAYFRTPHDDLETAQRQKLRHVLDKLMSQAGETLLDIGCGWGGLVREAATRGVAALGITLSSEQVKWFREHDNGNAGGEVELLHYHDLANQGRQFDKLASIGMAEHVGRHHLPGYVADLRRLLRPAGLGLVHCITGTVAGPTYPWLVKYIFPGGYIPTLNEMVRELSRQELVIWDVENLGHHYALTLDHWAVNFERNVAWVHNRYGEEFVRMWRLYLNLAAASFECEDTYVHQILFSNGKPGRLPLTREHLYGAAAALPRPYPRLKRHYDHAE